MKLNVSIGLVCCRILKKLILNWLLIKCFVVWAVRPNLLIRTKHLIWLKWISDSLRCLRNDWVDWEISLLKIGRSLLKSWPRGLLQLSKDAFFLLLWQNLGKIGIKILDLVIRGFLKCFKMLFWSQNHKLMLSLKLLAHLGFWYEMKIFDSGNWKKSWTSSNPTTKCTSV